MKTLFFRKQDGFTYLELLLVVALVIILGVLSTGFYSRFITQNGLANATNQFVSDLRKAQLYAMNGRQNSNWGVYFANNIITLYNGYSYSTRNTSFDEKFSVPSGVTVGGGITGGSITFDAASSTSSTAVTSTLSWSHTTSANNNRLLVVGVSETWDDTVKSITYGGVALTKVNSSVCGSSACHTEMWYLLSPPSGTNTVLVTLNISEANVAAGASTYYNVDQTNPLGTSNISSASTSKPSISVTSTTSQVIVDTIAINTSQVWTPGSGQTQLYQNNPAANSNMAASSYKQGLSSTTNMSWNAAANANWAAIAVPINPSTGTTFDINFSRATGTPSGTLSFTLSGVGNINTIVLNSVGTPTVSSNWYDTNYLYKKSITIDHTKVSGGTDLGNFPVLVSFTDPSLRTVANGGYVQSISGYDIIFTDSSQSTKLDYEIEKYIPSTGEVEAWVRIPTLSANSDTVFYMYYDNSSISSSQENKTGVWKNYVSVYHLKEDPSGTAPQMKDSTVNGNHATSNGGMLSTDQVNGQIDGSLNFGGSTFLTIPNSNSLNTVTNALTVSAWVNGTVLDTTYRRIISSKSYPNQAWEIENDGGGNSGIVYYAVNGNFGYSTTKLSTGQWYYVTMTSNNSNILLYINGSLDANIGIGAVAPTGGVVGIGADPNGSTPWNGKLDEVRISNTALSAGWIATEYKNQNSPSTFYNVGGQIGQ